MALFFSSSLDNNRC